MIVCIDCFKLFQTISNKNKTCNGPGSQSESENRKWHHAQTSRRKKCIPHTFWKDNKWSKTHFFPFLLESDIKLPPLVVSQMWQTSQTRTSDTVFNIVLTMSILPEINTWHLILLQKSLYKFSCLLYIDHGTLTPGDLEWIFVKIHFNNFLRD